jgi:hypothetical protein
MAVDSEPASSTAAPVPGNAEDPSKKGKANQGKKVCTCAPHVLDTNCRNSTQTPEKRPEVRFLEVSEIPGITISPRFQKYLNIKRIKTDHPNVSQEARPGKRIHSSFFYPVCSCLV